MRHRITAPTESTNIIAVAEPLPEASSTALNEAPANGRARRTTNLPRESNSFTAIEIRLAHQLFNALTRGADVRVLVRNSAYPALARKFLSMHSRIESKKIDDTLRPKAAHQ